MELEVGLLDREVLHSLIAVREGQEGGTWETSEQQILFFLL
jgi:hypothetical protein